MRVRLNMIQRIISLPLAPLLVVIACNSDRAVDTGEPFSLDGEYLGVYSYYFDGVSEPISQPIEFRFSSGGYNMWWDWDRDTSATRTFCDAPGPYDTTGGITLGPPEDNGVVMICDTSLSPKGDFWPWLKGDTLILYQPSFVELNDFPTALQEARRRDIISAGPDSEYALRRKLVLWPDE